MGLYNRIKYKQTCVNCGAEVEWQSKHLVIDEIYPVANVLETYEIDARLSGEMHTYCGKCDTSMDAEIVKGEVQKIEVKPSNKR
jgi:hypothetical protein